METTYTQKFEQVAGEHWGPAEDVNYEQQTIQDATIRMEISMECGLMDKPVHLDLIDIHL